MSDRPSAQGSCLCGDVRYKFNDAPVRMVQCHCQQCQKISGTGHASQAFSNEQDVSIDG